MDADKKKIWVSGQTIEVTDAVYEAYMKGDRKMRYFENDLKAERILLDEDGQIKQIILSREDSLDRLIQPVLLLLSPGLARSAPEGRRERNPVY